MCLVQTWPRSLMSLVGVMASLEKIGGYLHMTFIYYSSFKSNQKNDLLCFFGSKHDTDWLFLVLSRTQCRHLNICARGKDWGVYIRDIHVVVKSIWSDEETDLHINPNTIFYQKEL